MTRQRNARMTPIMSRRQALKKIDLQTTLRDFVATFVQLNRPERLLKMITRFLDREFQLTHASFLVYVEEKKHYVFMDSKGAHRLPVSLLKIDSDHPMAAWFRSKNGKQLNSEVIDLRVLRQAIARPGAAVRSRMTEINQIVKIMEMLKVKLVMPAIYKHKLIGLLLLGPKKNAAPFTRTETAFLQNLALNCSVALKTAEYNKNLEARNQELAQRVGEIERLRQKEHDTYYEIMRSLAQEVHAKDPYTFGHIGQVERLGLMTAKEMGMDLTGRKKDILSAGLILHDVGKIGIPDHILKKPARLTPEEWVIMKTHVDKGAGILGHLSAFKEVAEIVRAHHENFDGSGYPNGLKGSQIPVEARIVSVVDAFHAIVSTRCYSKGRPLEVAFEELRRCAGTQFDPEVVEAFIRAMTAALKKRGIEHFLRESAA